MENKYVRLLQFLIGTEVDGDFGPNSRAAADNLIDYLTRILDDFKHVERRDSNGAD